MKSQIAQHASVISSQAKERLTTHSEKQLLQLPHSYRSTLPQNRPTVIITAAGGTVNAGRSHETSNNLPVAERSVVQTSALKLQNQKAVGVPLLHNWGGGQTVREHKLCGGAPCRSRQIHSGNDFVANDLPSPKPGGLAIARLSLQPSPRYEDIAYVRRRGRKEGQSTFARSVAMCWVLSLCSLVVMMCTCLQMSCSIGKRPLTSGGTCVLLQAQEQYGRRQIAGRNTQKATIEQVTYFGSVSGSIHCLFVLLLEFPPSRRSVR